MRIVLSGAASKGLSSVTGLSVGDSASSCSEIRSATSLFTVKIKLSRGYWPQLRTAHSANAFCVEYCESRGQRVLTRRARKV